MKGKMFLKGKIMLEAVKNVNFAGVTPNISQTSAIGGGAIA